MASKLANYPVNSDSQGKKTNPDTSEVMADTGALGATTGGGGIYEVYVLVWADDDAEFVVQRRNAANSAAVGDVLILPVKAGIPAAMVYKFEVERGERLRVMMNAALTGDAVATLQAQRIA